MSSQFCRIRSTCPCWRETGWSGLVVIDGATHIDLYDKDEYVTPAVAKLAEFLGKYLAG
ncbi:alpha/beta hydrolase [Actinoallomurus purpureus]|uniref:alpha/beta hydrolase n=1 Tax=Actinoallomurus purpureus TaxID=478114 RepID=UPI002092AF9A|nr:alpha/beta hydrolase [Actinoallomurus purpureus]MCO6011744.1 alpha/beta hydrolase [Actinoallomurus purpureus]